MYSKPINSKDRFDIMHLAQALISRKTRLAMFWHAAIVSLLFFAGRAQAASLSWDAGNTNNGATIDPGSGSWNTDTTTNLNWNNGSGNVSWTQTSTTAGLNTPTFGGPDGTYNVVLDGVQIAALNPTIAASGYTFSGSPLFVGPDNTAILSVADGKSVVFNNNIVGNNNQHELRLGSLGVSGPPATMVILGNLTGMQPVFTSTNGSVFILGGNNSSGTIHVNADVRQTNGTFIAAGAFIIGRQRATSEPNTATGSFTVDGPATVFNHNNDYLSLGRVQDRPTRL